MRAMILLPLWTGCEIYSTAGETGLDPSDTALSESGTGDEDPGFPDESTYPDLLDCEEVVTFGYTTPSGTLCTSGVAAWLLSDSSTYSTVQDAIDAAPTGDTVTVCAGTWLENLRLDTSLNLRGYGANMSWLDGAYQGRVLEITGNPDVTLQGLALIQGVDGYDGGAVSAAGGTLSVSNVLFERNTSGYEGGALDAYTTDLTIARSCFRFNGADYEGGAVNAGYQGSVSITGSVFVYNDAGYEGGAIAFGGRTDDITLDITDSTLAWNIAGYSGGALSIGSREFSTTTISGSRLEDNFAENEGGAIAIGSWGGNTLVLEDSAVIQNESSSGGGVSVGGWGSHAVELTDTWFVENEVTDAGGALDSGSRCTATLSMIGGGVIANEAPDGGGGFAIHSETTLSVTEAHFGSGTGDNEVGDVNSYTGWGAFASFTCDGTTCD